ncbi:hypothetical protein [Vulcaniibacterium tengchongense]|uniref:Uncharacterized protein n=1 Tax=Vulcaniibacterium tengchongense TaxID=1273429 RepID=A0A3N4V7V7_9GAMM|nr:hypothetical protein [Vulcaniibacterium tengchongense]RPE75791.1 hypothetical protein EDC50_2686 [Vulcaniibacterium tengchongense]
MKESRFLHKVKFYFWALLFACYSVAAAGVMIDVLENGDYAHLSQVAVTTVESSPEVRMSSAAQIAAVFRAQSGAPFSTLPPGSTFKVVWPDGSSEYVTVVNPAASDGVEPIPGSQRTAEQNRAEAAAKAAEAALSAQR